MIKVRVKKDFRLFGKQFYAGQEIVVSREVYEQIKDKVEVIEEVQDASAV